jgi:hypothetical protein
MFTSHRAELYVLMLGIICSVVAGLAPQSRGASATFSGQATAARTTVLGMTTVLSDTGPLPASGGAQDASLLTASVPGVLSAEVLHAAAIGQGDRSRAEASVANVGLTVGGDSIAADFLMARAMAVCAPGGASVSGSSEIVALSINGQAIVVTGEPNQTIALPDGHVVINEQVSSVNHNTGEITVNALHVVIDGLADVVIASAHADITCQGTPICQGGDFVTGGGWITAPSGAKGTFGVAGGLKNGALWGHLTYIDHGNGLQVKGTEVTAYVMVDAATRHIEGTAEINGQGGFTYQVDVADHGEPGRDDTLELRLSTSYDTGTRRLEGGNIQLHTPCH